MDLIPDIYDLTHFNEKSRETLLHTISSGVNMVGDFIIDIAYNYNYEIGSKLFFNVTNNVIGIKLFHDKYDFDKCIIITDSEITINTQHNTLNIKKRVPTIIDIDYNAYILYNPKNFYTINFYKISNIHSFKYKYNVFSCDKNMLKIFNDKDFVKYFININYYSFTGYDFQEELFINFKSKTKYINNIFLPVCNAIVQQGHVKIKRYKINDIHILYMIEYIKLDDIYIYINKFKDNIYLYSYNITNIIDKLKIYNLNNLYIDIAKINVNCDAFYVM